MDRSSLLFYGSQHWIMNLAARATLCKRAGGARSMIRAALTIVVLLVGSSLFGCGVDVRPGIHLHGVRARHGEEFDVTRQIVAGHV
jgi:hypothetical protein